MPLPMTRITAKGGPLGRRLFVKSGIHRRISVDSVRNQTLGVHLKN